MSCLVFAYLGFAVSNVCLSRVCASTLWTIIFLVFTLNCTFKILKPLKYFIIKIKFCAEFQVYLMCFFVRGYSLLFVCWWQNVFLYMSGSWMFVCFKFKEFSHISTIMIILPLCKILCLYESLSYSKSMPKNINHNFKERYPYVSVGTLVNIGKESWPKIAVFFVGQRFRVRKKLIKT